MSHNLELAQKHAWNLARTLMTTVILFQSDAEVEALYVYDPYSGARSVH